MFFYTYIGEEGVCKEFRKVKFMNFIAHKYLDKSRKLFLELIGYVTENKEKPCSTCLRDHFFFITDARSIEISNISYYFL